MKCRRLFAIALFLLGTTLGCSGQPTEEPAGVENRAGSNAADQQQQHEGEKAANTKLANSVSLAEVYLRHGNLDEAEKTIRQALADPLATDRGTAMAVLDRILGQRNMGAAPERDTSTAATGKREPAAPDAPLPPQEQSGAKAADADQVATSLETAAPEPKPTAGREELSAPAPEPVAKAPPPPTPIIKVPAEDKQITETVEAAARVSVPVDALEIWDHFLARYTFTEKQQERIDAQLKLWRDRDEQKLIRLGSRWATREEAKEIADRASDQISGALAALDEDLRRAQNMLQRASTTDPAGIRADFILGMLHSLRGMNNPLVAKKHFRSVVARSPENVAALNNLALAELKLRDYTEAYQHWKRAVEVSPTTPEVTQNLGRLTAEIQKRKIPVPTDWAARFETLYRNAVGTGAPEAHPKIGWLYVPQVLPEVEKKAENDRAGDGPEETEKKPEAPPRVIGQLVNTGTGSGFVIHDGYVLTNRHVVEDDLMGVADALRMVDPSDPAHVRTFDAQFVAMSDDYDVALLKCPDLKAPAVRMANELPKRGSEVLVLGYPQTENFGRNLKTTRGIITSLPDPTQPGDLKHMLLFDAAANPGNSGGPVCDGFGRAVALLTIATTQGDFIQYTGGVPTHFVLPFVQQQIPDLNAPQPGGARLEWPDVDAQVSPSTVLIMAFYRGVAMRIEIAENPGRAVPDRENLLEDLSCSVCNGLSRLPCPQDGCVKGALTFMVPKERRRVFNGVTVVERYQIAMKKPCATCDGGGSVDCPACTHGIDSSLLSR